MLITVPYLVIPERVVPRGAMGYWFDISMFLFISSSLFRQCHNYPTIFHCCKIYSLVVTLKFAPRVTKAHFIYLSLISGCKFYSVTSIVVKIIFGYRENSPIGLILV